MRRRPSGDARRRHPVVGDGVRREDLTEEGLERLRARAGTDWNFGFLSKDEREANRRSVLDRHPRGDDLWIFGYGSLMWNPAIEVAERRPARLRGWHRRFCLWLPAGRGTAENPGLMMALDRGGSCRGVALRIAARHIEHETEVLWRREMLAGAYDPRWVSLHSAEGEIVGVTFVVNRTHPLYAGRLPPAVQVRHLATAKGRLGRARDYLHNTVVHLDELGVADGPLHRLLAKVERYRGGPR
ncbi:MAG: gamma-glutamylcyclotransferase [Alphaproteobacteria bacterium]|nr:gamma-glutamylcyclotransferase [Alphaproteobacteria bacterium]